MARLQTCPHLVDGSEATDDIASEEHEPSQRLGCVDGRSLGAQVLIEP
jgi:hypothetical protein